MSTTRLRPQSTVGERDGSQVTRRLMADLSGLIDGASVGMRTSEVVSHELGLPVSLFALHDPDDDSFAMRGTCGTRTDQLAQVRLLADQGIGGRVVAEQSTVVAEDYLTDSRISNHFRPIVGREELRGMAAVPILQGDRPIGVLYGAHRSVGRPGDGVVGALEVVALSVAPVLAMALATEQQIRRNRDSERQRMAGTLHDDVGSMLFAIGAAAKRAKELAADQVPEMVRLVDQIEQHTRVASESLRDILSDMAPAAPGVRVPVAAQRDLDDFRDRHGIPAHLLVQGVPTALPPRVERTLLACLRQALFNVERHAGASLVMATLEYQPGWISLAVQDDGLGPPEGFEPPAVPSESHHWGFTSTLREVDRLGGTASLLRQESGGALLRVRLPAQL